MIRGQDIIIRKNREDLIEIGFRLAQEVELTN